jgi:hypothetical protein
MIPRTTWLLGLLCPCVIGCTTAFSAGYAQSTKTGEPGGFGHVYGGFGGDDITITAGMRGRFAASSGSVAISGGVLGRYELAAWVHPYIHVGMDTYDFGYVDNEFLFGMFSLWAEAGFCFGSDRFVTVSAAVIVPEATPRIVRPGADEQRMARDSQPVAPPAAMFELTNVPSGAAVFDADGTRLGVTPLTLAVLDAATTYRLERRGYARRKKVVKPDTSGIVKVTLKKKSSGLIDH